VDDGVEINFILDDAFVDEVKRTAKACQIFLFFPVRHSFHRQYSLEN